MNKFSWTKKKLNKLEKVRQVLKEFQDYKPLTLRQVFYQLVSCEYIENTKSQYGMLSNLLKWARIAGYVPWEDIEDRVRAYHNLTGWYCKDNFIKRSFDSFLEGYRRDLLQDQGKYIEVWIEKDALSSIFTRVCDPYRISVIVCRGFSSVSFLHDFKKRLSYYKDKTPLMLYFGDFDPSGMEMLTSMKKTLNEDLNIKNIKFKRVALSRSDIERYNLPHDPSALKKTDTRAKKHIKAHGEIAVELDALRPDILIGKIKTAIEKEIDLKKFYCEKEREKEDLFSLARLKNGIDLTGDYK